LNGAARERGKNEAEGAEQLWEMRQSSQDMKSVFTQSLGRFDKRAFFLLPAAKEEQPMLNQGEQELSIDFCQDLVGLLRTPLINGQIGLPQLEEQFDLPTKAL
jgi:hypothetical protein